MEYRNLFLDKNEDELRILYQQYLVWQNTAVIEGTELKAMRDEYKQLGINTFLHIMERDLLRTIAKYWYVDQQIKNGGKIQI